MIVVPMKSYPSILAVLFFFFFVSPSAVQAKFFLDESSKLNYEDFFKAVKEVSKGELIRNEEEVRAFLESSESFGNLDDSELSTIKNNLADRLIRITEYKSKLPEVFLEILQDGEQSVLWQDYVIQKVPNIYGDASAGEKRELLNQLSVYLSRKEGVISGTTLLAYMRIAEKESRVQTSQVGLRALQIASDESYGDGNRITALSVGQHCGNRRIYDVAYDILESRESVTLKSTALSILSFDSSEKYADEIRSYLGHSDYRMRKSASAAVKRMEERNNG